MVYEIKNIYKPVMKITLEQIKENKTVEDNTDVKPQRKRRGSKADKV